MYAKGYKMLIATLVLQEKYTKEGVIIFKLGSR